MIERQSPIHPFPARMAPEIALEVIARLPPSAKVLDPMTGSGTVVRSAVEGGLSAYGTDLDPLAVLLSSVWTSCIDVDILRQVADQVVDRAKSLRQSEEGLEWIDGDEETLRFVKFWFGSEQERNLRKLARVLVSESGPMGDALRLCLSRIIITKKVGASLAWDVSHSRPHRVTREQDYDVFAGFLNATRQFASRLSPCSIKGTAEIGLADARNMPFSDATFDAIITSPPYLNAIDYMRGHKLSLVWLGYRLSDLRDIRSRTIGAERGIAISSDVVVSWAESQNWFQRLADKEQKMVRKYAQDISCVLKECQRVLAPSGTAVFVVGNNCIKGVYVENASIVEFAAAEHGLVCLGVSTRDIPVSRRYLPTPLRVYNEELSKRMRTEIVLTFAHRS